VRVWKEVPSLIEFLVEITLKIQLNGVLFFRTFPCFLNFFVCFIMYLLFNFTPTHFDILFVCTTVVWYIYVGFVSCDSYAQILSFNPNINLHLVKKKQQTSCFRAVKSRGPKYQCLKELKSQAMHYIYKLLPQPFNGRVVRYLTIGKCRYLSRLF